MSGQQVNNRSGSKQVGFKNRSGSKQVGFKTGRVQNRSGLKQVGFGCYSNRSDSVSGQHQSVTDQVRVITASGQTRNNGICKQDIYWNHKGCGTRATLDADEYANESDGGREP
ncbi:hypothetical protein GQ457_05G013120 [Hibiscus cannabinus]